MHASQGQGRHQCNTVTRGHQSNMQALPLGPPKRLKVCQEASPVCQRRILRMHVCDGSADLREDRVHCQLI